MNAACARSLRIIGWAALALLQVPSLAHAQAAITRGGFVIVSGTDTVAVEQFERDAETLSGQVSGSDGKRFRYVARLRPDGTVAEIESSIDWGWWANSVIQFTGDAIRLSGNLRGRPHRRDIAATGRTMPMYLVSFALVEQLLRSTREGSQGESVRLVQLETLVTTSWNVARPSADAATIGIPGFGEVRIATRPDGGIASGVIAALGWNITRTAGPPASTRQTTLRWSESDGGPITSFDRCNEATGAATVRVELPGTPVMALATPDGCWLVTSLAATKLGWPGAIVLLRRSAGTVSLARVLPLEATAYGMALTHDGSLLLVAAGEGVVFVDLQRLIMGRTDAVLGELRDGGRPVRFHLNVSADDRLLFVSDEGAETITVIDLIKARASGFAATAVVGKIPVGQYPVALTFSPDQRDLYTTSQIAPARLGWAKECLREGSGAKATEPVNPQGAVLVVDVERAKSDPGNAVVGAVPAGCSPVRLVLSPKGETAYVTARNSDAVLAFDMRKLRESPVSALLGRVPVGAAPVGVAVVDEGARIIVANSNRFGRAQAEGGHLSVVDTARISAGASAVVGTIATSALPREITTTSDGRTVLVTGFSSSALEIIDWERAVVFPTRR